ncbi:hypothetical protein [Stratiformator vulcanicus]|uniref:hypothetical protein n=1 Tax=Stratiformator vulcanicus TaxID=2527980 RepID=UPI0011A1C9F4|nr:hypothetical protein [Stratiformator vulcanicus]
MKVTQYRRDDLSRVQFPVSDDGTYAILRKDDFQVGLLKSKNKATFAIQSYWTTNPKWSINKWNYRMIPIASISMMDSPIKVIVQSKGFTVTSRKQVRRNNRVLEKITWRQPVYNPSEKNDSSCGGEFLFDPSRHWVLMEWEYYLFKDPPRLRAVIDYDGEVEGIPIPATVTVSALRNNEKPAVTYKNSRKEINFEKPNIELFTLGSFGIPDRIEDLMRKAEQERSND